MKREILTQRRRDAQSPKRKISASLLLVLLLISSGTQTAHAQETNRAGLVVIDGAGASHTFCVDFREETISGYDLLQRSGLDLNVEASAMGATICAIDGTGCAYPAESCFCQCQGSPCLYWSYWTLAEEGWRYETLGAGNTRIRNGDVQGWRWGAGTATKAEQPPLQTWAALCEDLESNSNVAEAAPTTVAPVAVATAGATTPSSVGADELTAPAPVNLAQPNIGGGNAVNGMDASALLTWLGVLAVPLVLGGWLMWRRRGQR